MSNNVQVDFIFGGPGKTASTWIYECLREHPEIAVPDTDSLDFFNTKYQRSLDWYRQQLPNSSEGRIVGELSQGYISHPQTPQRIADACPDVDIFFCIRNPVKRAFSHWWHGFGKNYHNYEFNQIVESHACYRMWAESGFYANHIERFEKHLSESQIHLFYFDDLKKDNRSFIQNVFSDLEVDDEFVPSLVGDTSNEATQSAPQLWLQSRDWLRKNAPEPVKRIALEPIYHTVHNLVESRSEYESGMDPKIRHELEQLYASDVRRLSNKTGRDFSNWFDTIDYKSTASPEVEF